MYALHVWINSKKPWRLFLILGLNVTTKCIVDVFGQLIYVNRCGDFFMLQEKTHKKPVCQKKIFRRSFLHIFFNKMNLKDLADIGHFVCYFAKGYKCEFLREWKMDTRSVLRPFKARVMIRGHYNDYKVAKRPLMGDSPPHSNHNISYFLLANCKYHLGRSSGRVFLINFMGFFTCNTVWWQYLLLRVPWKITDNQNSSTSVYY